MEDPLKHLFYPDATAKSSYDIPYEELYKLGYRGVVYDIDNTLVPHGAPADQRAIEHFKDSEILDLTQSLFPIIRNQELSLLLTL